MHSETLNDPETLKLIGRFHAIQLDRWSDTPVVTPEQRAEELRIRVRACQRRRRW